MAIIKVIPGIYKCRFVSEIILKEANITKFIPVFGYIVYRDIAPNCLCNLTVTMTHKVAVFVDEFEAIDYCNYRNKCMKENGTDELKWDNNE